MIFPMKLQSMLENLGKRSISSIARVYHHHRGSQPFVQAGPCVFE